MHIPAWLVGVFGLTLKSCVTGQHAALSVVECEEP